MNNLICIRFDLSRSKLPTVVPLDFFLTNDFIADNNIDLFALTETWLRCDDLDLYYIRDICQMDTFYLNYKPLAAGLALLKKYSNPSMLEILVL